MKTIFVVDDNDVNLTVAKETLKTNYRVLTMESADKMFSLLKKITPDLILLDIEMPGMDGFEAIARLKESEEHAGIPVIFLTGMTDEKMEVRGFQMGAIDFVAKPFTAPILLNRIKTHLEVDELIKERTKQLQTKTEQLQSLQNAVIFGFADIVEARDEGTGGHIERTSAYLKVLVDAMAERGVYSEEISKLDLDLFVSSSRLHDVGKIAISDLILNKPGKLTDEEFATMKTHTTEGERAIDRIASRTDDVEFLNNAKLFAGYHHERWDGRGYPYGLSETGIPFQGRAMAIADVYDALISERPYKKPFTADEAYDIIMDGAGKHFDPLMVEVFSEIRGEFEKIAV